ncbi:MAG: tRNA lysidine(34) synthetase TilS [Limisphaerales bacterium]
MTDLLQRIENQIQNRRLLKRGEKILVAVSGGLDSMLLLHALKILSTKSKWKIIVAHFNHKLRGHASDADEKLVRRTASKLKLPLVVESADVKSFAKKSKLSIEMAARKLRHEFFARVARERKIKTIALAHHADDQVELFFLRLLRGAGAEGLAGMKWKSASPADRRISIIRPLLDLTKAELQEFARENKIQFRNDATNFSPDFLRNRIRNELLPLLRKDYQPSLNKTILRTMEIAGAESELIGNAAKNSRGEFEKMPLAIQRRVLQMQLAKIGVAADFDLIESLRQSANQFVSVGVKISVARNDFGEIELRAESKSEFSANELAVSLAGRAGEMIFDGAKFKWQSGSRGRSPHQKKIEGQKQIEFFDADKIGDKIILRHWRAGDRFQPIGLKSFAKLQDLFTNEKISQTRRRDLIVATTERGEIFWVEGLRISENFKIMPQTRQQLIWRWKNAG